MKCSLFIDRRSQQCSTILFLNKTTTTKSTCFLHKPFRFGFFQRSLWTLYPVVNNYTAQLHLYTTYGQNMLYQLIEYMSCWLAQRTTTPHEVAPPK